MFNQFSLQHANVLLESGVARSVQNQLLVAPQHDGHRLQEDQHSVLVQTRQIVRAAA